MTFSIVARSADSTQHGIAVASKFLAVGFAVPAAEAEVGALATQAYANLTYRQTGLALLRAGTAPADVVAGLIAADPGRGHRQLGVVGASGEGATYTGEECLDWAGGVTGDGYAVQGNILTGPDVVEAMREAWLDGDDSGGFAERLMAALAAGEAAGGDSRGRQSAALLVVQKGAGYGGFSDVAIDLRVDDDPDPVPKLRSMLRLHRMYFTEPDPATALPLADTLGTEVRKRLATLGHHGADTAEGLDSALSQWAGRENFEERLLPGKIDPDVLTVLREATAE